VGTRDRRRRHARATHRHTQAHKTLSMYVCRKVKNSQARTGHQRGMGGRETDAGQMTATRSSDTQTHTSSQDTHVIQLGCHTPRVGVHITLGHVPRPPCRPPQHPRCQGLKQQHTNTDRRQGVTCEARADCSASSNLAGRRARTRPCVGSCEVSRTESTQSSAQCSRRKHLQLVRTPRRHPSWDSRCSRLSPPPAPPALAPANSFPFSRRRQLCCSLEERCQPSPCYLA